MQLVWTRKVLAAVAAVACVGLMAVPSSTAKDPLPEGGAAKQQETDLAYLKATIEKSKAAYDKASKQEDKEKALDAVDSVRSTALLVAQSAQNRMGGKDDEQLAGLRDQMVKVADALSDSKKPDFAGALKAIDGVKGAKGKKEAVKLHEAKDFDLEVLMSVYSKAGRGWQSGLSKQSDKVTDVKLALEIAQGSLLIGQLTEHLPPEAVKSAQNKKDWAKFVQDMQKLSKEAADEAIKGEKADLAALAKKLTALDANCSACHKEFRK